MAVLFFLIWVIFNGKITFEIAIFGIIISGGLYLFCCKSLDYSPRYDWLFLKGLLLAVQYFFVLIWEVVLATLIMAGFIFNHRDAPEPVLVSFHPKLRTSLAQSILANSITMTPGTITVAMHNGDFQVHCYDKDMAVAIDDSRFVRILKRWEASI